jgi:hypothetical protein
VPAVVLCLLVAAPAHFAKSEHCSDLERLQGEWEVVSFAVCTTLGALDASLPPYRYLVYVRRDRWLAHVLGRYFASSPSSSTTAGLTSPTRSIR